MSGPSADLPLRSRPTVAITGASGALGQALLRPGTAAAPTGRPDPRHHAADAPGRGRRGDSLAPAHLAGGRRRRHWNRCWRSVDVLVLNHGVNLYGARDSAAVAASLEVNALSSWRLLELFARWSSGGRVNGRRDIAPRCGSTPRKRRSSRPSALSTRSASACWGSCSACGPWIWRQPGLRLRRLVLGPFRSALNPIGLMSSGFVARVDPAPGGLGSGADHRHPQSADLCADAVGDP